MSQPDQSRQVVSFGTFQADFVARELRKNNVKLRLQDQPFQVLALLLENAGRVVTREELRQRLWSADTFVDFDNGLNTAINKIREALGDSAESPRFIETVPRRGYRFVAPVQAALAGQAHLPPVRPASVREGIGWLGAAAVMLVLAGVGGYFYFHRAPKLTEKDAIILADFTNSTGDPVFDGTLQQGLSVQLEQTPFLRVISGDQITQTLKMMEQPVDVRLTPALAREVCQRTNATMEIEGSIATLGNQYILGLDAVNCATGETFAREQVTADGKEKVLNALNDAASELRLKLGESRASLERYDAPLDQATTSSLEALQAYSQARQALWKSDPSTALSLLERAVELDPNFAMASMGLGIQYDAFGDNNLGTKNLQRAYALRDRTSEYERLFISGSYSFFVTRDLEKAAQFYEQLTKTYPRDPTAWNALAASAYQLGQYEQGVAAQLKAVRLNPSASTYGQLAYGRILSSRFEEARKTIQQARASHIEPYQANWMLYMLDFFQNDQPGMAEQLVLPWTDMPPGTREDAQGATAAYTGHLVQARDWTRRAITSAKSAELSDLVADYKVESALREALFGNLGEARMEALEASRQSADSEVRGWAALALALSGDSAQAQKLADDLNRRFPEGTYVQFGSLPAIRGLVEIRRGNSQAAIENLRAISSHELICPPSAISIPAVPAYISGEVFLAARNGAEAAAEFQMITDRAGHTQNSPVGPLAHLGLSRAYVLEGDTAKARKAYQDFLTLWKDADPDIPILKQAKAEYAKLQ
jgi:eukaryotic-like serine/threonine-protein kinase